jgi:hypothetical protein
LLFVSPTTKFAALDPKTTSRPSALIAGISLPPFVGTPTSPRAAAAGLPP